MKMVSNAMLYLQNRIDERNRDRNSDYEIPKLIHYCWFGKNPKPELVMKCINSWRKYCPDYEIIEWNEDNYDIDCNDFVKEAYAEKKWAFVSDVARFQILYENGGVYFDTDVELLRPITNIVSEGAFMAREKGEEQDIAPGLALAVEPQNEILRGIIEYYNNQHFVRQDGSLNLCTVVTRVTGIMLKCGYDPSIKNEIQNIQGFKIYPTEYFCPKDCTSGEINITENTVAIHHYMGSWHNAEDEYFERIKKKYQKIMPKKIGGYLAKYVATVKFHGLLYGNRILIGWIKRSVKNES